MLVNLKVANDSLLCPGLADFALRDSEMTQIDTWNYFTWTWKRQRGISELILKVR